MIMIDLKQLLEEYKNLTLILIEKAKNDEELSENIEKKNNILREIKEFNYTEDEVKGIIKELNIPEIENELNLTIKKEMVKIKKKIENIRAARVARKMYRMSSQPQIELLRKKV